MWNPIQDILSGRALQLFEYNLAYSIPLYLHINENSDNENMLQFWYYASLARHLGIGGLNNKDDEKYKALKAAMTLYLSLKPFFTRGTFYGISQTIHLHVDDSNRNGVITAYNLSSRLINIEVKLDLKKYGLDINTIEIYNGINDRLTETPLNQENLLKVEIPPLSPIIAILK
jgi:hypothetical protein